MSKRLQVLFDESEYQKIKRHARQAKLSLGGWVRQALRRVTDQESGRSVSDKISAINAAARHSAPINDIEVINQQIASGYLKGPQ